MMEQQTTETAAPRESTDAELASQIEDAEAAKRVLESRVTTLQTAVAAAQRELDSKDEPDPAAFSKHGAAAHALGNAEKILAKASVDLDGLLGEMKRRKRLTDRKELFAKVNPAVHVAPHTARAAELIRAFVPALTAELNAMASGAASYNAALAMLNALGGIGCAPINLAPELVAIQKAIADLSGNAAEHDRVVHLTWVNSSPPFWKLDVNIPGKTVHVAVRP